MTRKYEQKLRAERQEETRRRIVEAAVELHTTVGPARTTDLAIAERAGVTRRTFYRHFPDEVSLFRACTRHALDTLPPPSPERWHAMGAGSDAPDLRLRACLAELYEYYGVAGPGLLVIGRDLPFLSPEIAALPARGHVLRALPEVLLEGWAVTGRRREIVAAAVRHACAVTTWQSLVLQQGLRSEEAVDLLVGLVVGAAAEGSGAVAAQPASGMS